MIAVAAANVLFLFFLAIAYRLVARRRRKVLMLVEHLSTLSRNEMPLHAGLRAVGRDLGGILGLRVTRVAQRVEEGKSLGEAFMEAPGTIPPLLCGMLALGDKCGNLAGFLEEMRRSYRRIADLPYQSVYLFLYPVILSVFINLAMTFLYAAIVPKFQTIFQTTGVKDSGFSNGWARLIMANEGILALCVLLVVLLALGGLSIHFGSFMFRKFKSALDRIILAIPLLGGMARDGAVQQFTLCSGLFLQVGARLPEAVRSAAGAERNLILRRRLERIAGAVEEGGRLSTAARNEGFLGEDLLWFMETGEASGMLADHLRLAALHYETKVRITARLVGRTVVPLFVLLNGLIVFGALYLTFQATQQVLRSVTPN